MPLRLTEAGTDRLKFGKSAVSDVASFARSARGAVTDDIMVGRIVMSTVAGRTSILATRTCRIIRLSAAGMVVQRCARAAARPIRFPDTSTLNVFSADASKTAASSRKKAQIRSSTIVSRLLIFVES